MATKCEQYQIDIKSLKESIPSLTNSFNSASASSLGYIDAFQNGFGNYNCGEDLRGEVDNLRKAIQGDSIANANFLTSGPNTVQFSSGKCKGGSLNCSKQGCINSISSVNTSLNNFFNTRSNLVVALKSLASKNSIFSNDPQCIAEQAAQTKQDIEDQEANRRVRNVIIIIVIAALVVGFLIFGYFKWWRK